MWNLKKDFQFNDYKDYTEFQYIIGYQKNKQNSSTWTPAPLPIKLSHWPSFLKKVQLWFVL